MDATAVFALFLVLTLIVYAVAGGLELGVGILLPLIPRDTDRADAMSSVKQVPVGNEVWLLLSAALLRVAFPAAFELVLSRSYPSVGLLVSALIVRRIASAFRSRTVRLGRVCDFAFAIGSIVAAFSQGLILGGIVDAVPMQGGVPSSGRFDPFGVLGIPCGIGLIGGYSLLGAGWLIWKTEGPAQVFGREVAHAALILSTVGVLAAIAWSSISASAVAVRWLAWPNLAFATPALLVSALLVLAIWRSLWSTRKALPFVLSAMLLIVGLAGLSVRLWPFVTQAQIAAASSHPGTQPEWSSGIGIVITMLVVFASQLLAYRLSLGKTPLDSTGHEQHRAIQGRRTASPVPGLHLS